jgi:aspartate aminotransferase-like enzyme
MPALDVGELITFLRSRKMIISDGYGPMKGKSFRIAHMGDTSLADLDELLKVMDAHILGLK